MSANSSAWSRCGARRRRRGPILAPRAATAAAAASGALDAPRDVGSCVLACVLIHDPIVGPPTMYGGVNPGPAAGGGGAVGGGGAAGALAAVADVGAGAGAPGATDDAKTGRRRPANREQHGRGHRIRQAARIGGMRKSTQPGQSRAAGSQRRERRSGQRKDRRVLAEEYRDFLDVDREIEQFPADQPLKRLHRVGHK